MYIFINPFEKKLSLKTSADTKYEEWVQKINQELSPKFWEFAMTFTLTTIEPLIQKVFKQNNLPDIGLKFTKLDLGDIAPQIGNLKVHDMYSLSSWSLCTSLRMKIFFVKLTLIVNKLCQNCCFYDFYKEND